MAIVGYTNAGKSTLLNTLTDASVLEEDKLFATLDPTTRNLELESGQQIMLTDTVGFIRRLCGGSVKNLVASLSDAGALSEQDIDELRAFLDAQEQ